MPVIKQMLGESVGSHIDPMLNERLLNILSTQENINLLTLGFDCELSDKYKAIVTPVEISGEAWNTFCIQAENDYSIDDIILNEYGTTVVGLELLNSVNAENAEESRKISIVRSAIGTLSFSELEAVNHIFEELHGTEGVLVASKIADRVG